MPLRRDFGRQPRSIFQRRDVQKPEGISTRVQSRFPARVPAQGSPFARAMLASVPDALPPLPEAALCYPRLDSFRKPGATCCARVTACRKRPWRKERRSMTDCKRDFLQRHPAHPSQRRVSLWPVLNARTPLAASGRHRLCAQEGVSCTKRIRAAGESTLVCAPKGVVCGGAGLRTP